MPKNIPNPEQDGELKEIEAEMRDHGFQTNDIIIIHGRYDVRINAIPIACVKNAFALLLLLAEGAAAAPGRFHTTEAIVEAIIKSQSRLGSLGLSWKEPTKESVHKAIWQLRTAIRVAKLNESLMKGRNQGYRLNTPRRNIYINPEIRLSSCLGQD